MAPAREFNIRMRRFGRTDLNVSEFGLGCARIGGIFKQRAAEFVELLSAAFDAGIRFFDTADIYSQGESETLLGSRLPAPPRSGRHRQQGRLRAAVAAQAGGAHQATRPAGDPVARLVAASSAGRRARFSVPGLLAAAPSRAVEGSLRRLRTDYLDLFQLHSPSTALWKRLTGSRCSKRSSGEGKIRYYGVSCDSLEAGMSRRCATRMSSLQVPINLLERAPSVCCRRRAAGRRRHRPRMSRERVAGEGSVARST